MIYSTPETSVKEITTRLYTMITLSGSTDDYSNNNGNFETPVWDDEESY